MQKVVYLSNSRDYTEQGNINENRYFKQVNDLLAEGWTISAPTPTLKAYVLNIQPNQEPFNKETLAAFVVLEKPDEA